LTSRVGYSVGDSLQGSPGGCPVNLSAPVRREHLSMSSVHFHQISALEERGWLRGRAEHPEGTTSYRVRRGRGVTRRAVHYLDVCAAHLDSAAALARAHLLRSSLSQRCHFRRSTVRPHRFLTRVHPYRLYSHPLRLHPDLAFGAVRARPRTGRLKRSVPPERPSSRRARALSARCRRRRTGSIPRPPRRNITQGRHTGSRLVNPSCG
jgi:hypothetical protein